VKTENVNSRLEVDTVRSTVVSLMPDLLAELEALVAIPSIAFPGFPPGPVHRMSEAVLDLFRRSGVEDVRLLQIPGGYPAVYADLPGPAGSPTVLLYAHYDVQPAPGDGWETDPFTPTVKDGRLYGRGAADDKSGIVAHLAALRALDGTPPVHVKVLVEGSEENGRQALLQIVDAQPELLRADVMVIADNGNWKVGEPTLSQTLRGHGKLTVTLRTLTGALHSGHFGGAAPDALLALTRLIASLHDDDGNLAVVGLEDGHWDGADWPETTRLVIADGSASPLYDAASWTSSAEIGAIGVAIPSGAQGVVELDVVAPNAATPTPVAAELALTDGTTQVGTVPFAVTVTSDSAVNPSGDSGDSTSCSSCRSSMWPTRYFSTSVGSSGSNAMVTTEPITTVPSLARSSTILASSRIPWIWRMRASIFPCWSLAAW